ncbi:MAG: hypothetical protein R3B93_19150 [Bacteroidia bacterium]
MKGNKLYIIGWFILLLGMGCSVSLSSEDYLAYSNNPERGLIKEKSLNSLHLSMQYRPVDYIIAQESRGEAITQEAYKKRKSELETSQYFKLRIKSESSPYIMEHNLVSLDDVEIRRQELLYGLRPRVKMVCGGDTLACAIHHVEETYGLAPFVDINLVFPSAPEGCDPQIIMEEFGFQTGTIKFKFNQEEITHLPSLKLN